MSWPLDSFLNARLWPLLLLGLFPLILHLLDRRRARRVEWPAVRFFMARGRKTIRRMMLKEYLLVALRTGVILFLALALMRPRGDVEVASSDGRRGVIIVLDTSYSMAFRPDPTSATNLTVARDAALRLLGSLGEEDVVHVIHDIHDIHISDRPGREATPRAGPVRPGEARRRVLAAVHTPEPFDLLEAIHLGATLCRDLSTPSREIYLFTDLREAEGESTSPGKWRLLRSRLVEQVPGPSIHLVDCGQESAANRYVRDLTRPDLALGVDEPVEVSFEIGASGEVESTVLARVHAEDELILEKILTLDSKNQAHVSLRHRFSTAGNKKLRVSLQGDGLEQDDVRHLTIDVRERIDVLIVETLSTRHRKRTGHYIYMAAWPHTPGHSTPRTVLRPRRADTLDEAGAAAADVIILADLPRPSAEEVAVLESHLRRGGGVFLLVGSEADADVYNQRLFRNGRGVLPARLEEWVRVPATGPLHPGGLALSHPSLDIFADPEQGDLELVEIRSYWKTGSRPRETAVLASVGGDSPWLLERSHGQGRVLLLTTSALVSETDLPLTPLFPPLIHRMVKYVASGTERPRALIAGETLRVKLPAKLGRGIDEPVVTVRTPAGERASGRIVDEGDHRFAIFTGTQVPGFYQLEVRARDETLHSETWAVNFPVGESRLHRIDGNTLASLAEALGIQRSAAATPLVPREVTRWVDIDYWPHAASIALVLLLLELAFLRSLTGGKSDGRVAGGLVLAKENRAGKQTTGPP